MTKKSTSPTSRNPRKKKSAGLQYQSLEQRLPLDASFTFAGGVLTINSFTNDTALGIEANNGVITASLDGEEFMGNAPGVTPNADLDEIEVAGVTSIFIASGNTSPSDVTFDLREALTLDDLNVNVRGNIQFNSRGNDFNATTTRFVTTGNLTQTDNSPGVATNVDFGDLGFNVNGDVSFDSLSGIVFDVDPITGQVLIDPLTGQPVVLAGGVLGGRAGGDLTIVSDIGDLNFTDQFGADFNNDNDVDALFVGGDASLTIGVGSIAQSDAVGVNGDFNISTASDGLNSIDLSVISANNFSTVNLANRTPASPAVFRIADRNAFTIDNLRAQDVYLGAGRLLPINQLPNGQLDITGSVTANTLAIQTTGGVDQAINSSIFTERLVIGGESVFESSGDYLFRGRVEGRFFSPGDLVEIDVAFQVRGSLDLFTESELNFIDTDLIFTDGRDAQQFETSYVDGNARISANSIDFSVEFETSKFVLDLESDGTQTADSSILAEQLYVSGARINFDSELNDVEQIAALGTGDESFIRFFDTGTIRIVNLDGEITGGEVNGGSTARTLPAIAGVSTERFPQISIGDNSFIDLRTGFGGPVLNPRLGAPNVALDDIERFEIERDANILSFETNQFGQNGRGTYFVEFIHDGVSPFEIVAQGTGFDAELALYDEVGNLVFSADDPVLNLNARITGDDFAIPLPAGRYFIASAAFSATFADNFNVQTQFTPSTQPTGILRVTLEIGQPSEVVTDDIVTIQSTLETGSSQDLRNFGFVLNENSDVSIFTGTNNRPGAESAFDTEIFVFALNADGTLGLLQGNDDDTGGGLDSFINLSLTAGQYIAVVGEFDIDDADARAGLGDAGEGGPFQITFAGIDGAVELPAGQLDPGLTAALLSEPLIQPVTETFLVPTDLTPAGAVNTFDPTLLNDPDSLVTGDSITITGSLDPGLQRLSNFGFVLEQEGEVTIFTGDPITTAQDSGFDTEFFIFELQEDGSLGALVATAGVTPDGFDSQITLTLTEGSYVAVLGEFVFSEADARTGNANIVDGGDFQITFEGVDGVVAVLPVTFQDRLNSFIAPEVRRSLFQDADAPIDTEKLFLSASEDGSIIIQNDLNQIDVLCIVETDDFMFSSSSTIDINGLNADGDVILDAVGDVTVSNIDATGIFTITTGANIFASNVDTGGDIDFTSVGVTRVTDVDTAGDVTINAGTSLVASNMDAVGAINLNSGRSASLQLISTQSTLNVVSGDDIVVDGITAASDVSLQAADDIRFSNTDGIRLLTADNLTLVANNVNNDFNGILLFTDVNSVSASVQRSGQIFLNEQSDINVGTLATNSGSISLRANGSISGTSVSVAQPGSSITLVARGGDGDISVGGISTTGSTDSIRLLADDDVFAQVRGGNLRVQAKNTVGDGSLSVNLATEVRTLSVDAGLNSNSVINRGDINVVETDGLILTRAVTVNGRISVNARGNLNSTNVQADGVSGDDVIQLSATGDGADLITSRVVVRNRIGGVVLRANDDIVETNINDQLMVVASRATYIAGNSQDDTFNGIIGQSSAATVSARVSSVSEAGVFMFGRGNTVVTDSSVANGRFSFINRSGVLRVDDVVVRSPDLAQVFLQTQGNAGDILVGDVDAGANGFVTIDSADDVFDTNARDEFFIRGDFLGVTSRNNNSDVFDGILLNVDVNDFTDAALNGGQSFIRRRS